MDEPLRVPAREPRDGDAGDPRDDVADVVGCDRVVDEGALAGRLLAFLG